MMRAGMLAALALALSVGCEKKARPLEGPPLRVAFGDCTENARYVSGPRPAPFEEDRLASMHDPVERPPQEDPTPEEEEVAEDTGTALALDEGKMGNEESTRETGRYVMKKSGVPPQLARKQAIDATRREAILEKGLQEKLTTITGTADFSSGFDDRTVFGGEMEGGFGTSSGWGTTGTGKYGTIGTGKYGTIGHGSGTGSGYGTGAGRGRSVEPQVRIGNTTSTGDLDKNIIRRYIRRKLPQIKYCYEKQLLVNQGLEGTVVTEFTILPDGMVAQSKANGVSGEVSTCVAGVIKTIQFPKPKGGGIVEVRYPFNFRPAEPAEPVGSAGATDPKPIPEPTPEPEPVADDAPAKGILQAPGYVPGTDNPLRTHGPGIEACFRKHRKPYGVAVVEMTFGDGGAVTAAKTHGDLGDALASCVSEAAKKARFESASGSTRRCPVAVGTAVIDQPPGRGGGPVPLVDITADQVSFEDTALVSVAALVEDTSPTWKIVPLYERSVHQREKQRENTNKDETRVTVTGPGVIRPVGTTPMKVVNRVVMTLADAGLDFVLAAEGTDGWRILRGIELPVVPVPRGSGETWNRTGWSLKGRAWAVDTLADDEPPIRLAILVTREAYWLGLTRVGEIRRVERAGDARDAVSLRESLAALGAIPGREGRIDAEIAADDDIAYADVVGVIDQALTAGLTDWMLTGPNALSVRFTQ
ncbi:MAG TPA: AgmX/PglI C-terminal domain-containing protein [Kofleriaceae bacterium]|nr:AgmX/PglI C-terminal domain-containing protein [Kofleriaceae bacterium]